MTVLIWPLILKSHIALSIIYDKGKVLKLQIEVFLMSQQSFPELQSCHVDDLKIPDFDERKTVQVAALLVKKFNNKCNYLGIAF